MQKSEKRTEAAARAVAIEKALKSKAIFPDHVQGVTRARLLLRRSIHSKPRMRLPNAQPPAQGAGLSQIAEMGRLDMKKYIEASLKMITSFDADQREDCQQKVNALQAEATSSLDVMDRADLPEIRGLPLLSALGKNEYTFPLPISTLREADLSQAHKILFGRLWALHRLATNDPVLTTIRLSYQCLDDDWLVSLAQALTKNHFLRHLQLAGNQITCLGVQSLAKSLHKHPSLQTLTLGGNRLSDQAALALADSLSSSRLLVLSLSAPKYHWEHFKSQYTQKEQQVETSSTTHDDATFDSFSDYGFDPLAWSLPLQKQQGEKLNAETNTIGPLGMSALAKSLPGSKLLELCLDGQSAGIDGAQALATALLQPKVGLKYLSLAANGIGDKGLIALVDAMCTSSCLRSLTFAANKATTQGAREIAAKLSKLQKEQYFLDISFNAIEQSGCLELERVYSPHIFIALHGNPGATALTKTPAPLESKEKISRNYNESAILPHSLPLRAGAIDYTTDSGFNSVHLRVSTPHSRRQKAATEYEPFTNIAQRAVEARSKREDNSSNILHLRKKRIEIERRGIMEASKNLPPAQFASMMQNRARFNQLHHEQSASSPTFPNGDVFGESPRVGATLKKHFASVIDSAPYGRFQGQLAKAHSS